MKINWLVRFKNKQFCLALVASLLRLAQVVAALFGVTLELDDLGGKLKDVINAVFCVLAVLGVVSDPTTAGVGDSERAQGYTEPWKDETTTD